RRALDGLQPAGDRRARPAQIAWGAVAEAGRQQEPVTNRDGHDVAGVAPDLVTTQHRGERGDIGPESIDRRLRSVVEEGTLGLGGRDADDERDSIGGHRLGEGEDRRHRDDQPTTFLRASPRAPASSADNSTTSRPPPSSGTRMTMPRPSLVTSSGPSPVRGFIAAMLSPLRPTPGSVGCPTATSSRPPATVAGVSTDDFP